MGVSEAPGIRECTTTAVDANTRPYEDRTLETGHPRDRSVAHVPDSRVRARQLWDGVACCHCPVCMYIHDERDTFEEDVKVTSVNVTEVSRWADG